MPPRARHAWGVMSMMSFVQRSTTRPAEAPEAAECAEDEATQIALADQEAFDACCGDSPRDNRSMAAWPEFDAEQAYEDGGIDTEEAKQLERREEKLRRSAAAGTPMGTPESMDESESEAPMDEDDKAPKAAPEAVTEQLEAGAVEQPAWGATWSY